MLAEKENIQELSIEKEMKDSYLLYAMSVLVSRALPDVRDGLKPSQRRILIAMDDLNLGPRSQHRKCAKICGDTSGNYHPHGEQSVYPTLVRMAQAFNSRYPLVDGQGNFGSIDGDPAGAMRYTEARLSPFSMLLLEDLKLDTVDFVPNYDETRKEPVVLPGKFPNLLCNGSSGIAVGMATSIPPHNIAEVCDAVIRIVDEPDCSIDELLKIIKGPDFPTGAIIFGREGIKEAYKSGRGTITVRARAHIETTKGGKKNIVFTEIPYGLSRDRIIERMADAVNQNRISGVADVRNESDKEGTRIVVELRRGENENVVLNALYKHTQLQDTYSVIMIALARGRPQTFNLKELLVAYKEHRVEVVRRRTAYLLQRAEDRAHILEGLRIAVKNIDAIVALIKRAKDVPSARSALMKKFKLTERQAQAILDMRLQRLTGLERRKIESEYKELMEEIKGYRAILADERLILDIIREDMYELKERYGDPRRTEIVEEEAEEFAIEDLIAEENVAVTITHEGYIKRMALSSYRRQNRGGVGITGADLKEGDFLEHLFIASTHDYLLFFTDRGKIYWQKVYDIPQMSRTSKGRAIVNLLQLQAEENITSMIPVRDFDKRELIMATEKGVVKKTRLGAFSHPQRGGIIAIKLDKKDTLIRVELTPGGDDVILGTASGQAIRFPAEQVRSMGRATHGVKGINLARNDKVVAMVIVPSREAEDGTTLLSICENGFGKRTEIAEYRSQSRGGKGLINIKTSERNGKVVSLMTVGEEDEVMLITQGGMVIRVPASSIRQTSRNTQGVKLISLKKDDRLVAAARVAKEDSEPEDAEVKPADSEEASQSGRKPRGRKK
ncbi:MAG: DNA gyrase subunit A [Planctomycetes bacterium DG_23]|nr:MAG: DNA gyrase subunit A [Planctomycetes bacterium DG_23]